MGTTLSPMTLWWTVQRRSRQLRFTPCPLSVERLELDSTRLPAGPDARGKPVHLAFAIGEGGTDNTVDRRYAEARAQRCAWHLIYKLEYQL